MVVPFFSGFYCILTIIANIFYTIFSASIITTGIVTGSNKLDCSTL